MKLSEYKNEDALDLLCDILEPTAEIFADKELATAVKSNCSTIKAVTIAIKNHKAEILQILARLDGIPVEEYSCNIATITQKLLEIVNDKELVDFFSSQGQKMEEISSTSATASTKGKKK